ncbi:Phox homologous domain-containing protein [Cladochytrium replicatum]|nr:Phox homologous domain-containing protein [Cladochytrium replicatum]
MFNCLLFKCSRQESVAGSIVAGTGSQRTSKVLTQGQRPRNMSTLNKPVRSVVISECFRKNHGSAKDYIYVMDVTYITSETNEIRHTYEDFFDFHLQLIGHFPEEAGVRIGLLRHDSPQESTKRLIPQLPGQIMFVTDAVAKSRISPLQEYLKAVLVLPPKISRSPWVLSFFRTNGKNAAAAIERDQLGEVEEADDPIEYDYE